jgi:drug/metabolite transporter (DMT)-like permease
MAFVFSNDETFLPRRQSGFGAGWMLVAAVFFALLGVFVKTGSHDFSPLELLFYRTLFGAVVLAAGAALRRQSPLTPNLGGHVKRTLIGYLSMCCLFYALSRLPLSTAITLNYTSSLFFVLVCTVKLKEPLELRSMLTLLLGFAGIVWLLQPTFNADLWLAGAIGLASGATAGLAVFQVRELGKMGEAPWRIVFWFFTLSSCMGWVVVHFWGGFHLVTLRNVGSLLGVGVSGLLAQLAMTRAYRDGQKFLVSSFAYMTVVFSVLLGALIWHEAIGWSGLAAMALIVISGVLSALRR